MKKLILISTLILLNTLGFAQKPKLEKATFGMGCFWCSEAVFQRVKGVVSIKSGYEGGNYANPTYEEVCTGTTGHAEVVELQFDPAKVSYATLLEIFWKTHDPTTLNRQGADVGTQYRSAIFYHNVNQKETAEKFKKDLNAAKVFENPIVTEITSAKPFYVAENYHQDYFLLNCEQPYCKTVILPKMQKLEKLFKSKLKN